MKMLFAYILAVLALLLSKLALADQDIERELAADSDSIVEIEHMSGKAKIVGWDSSMVRVSGTLGDDTESFTFERVGKTIKIEVEVKNRSWGNWMGSDNADNLLIQVPLNSRVKYDSTNASVEVSRIFGSTSVVVINGNVDVEDLQGRIKLESVNGDIEAENIRGDVTIQAVNGDIEVDHREGEEIRVTAVNGDIEFSSTAADARVETVNGHVEVIFSTVEDLTLDTVNGSIRSSMSLTSGAIVKASSVSGNIELRFNEDVAAKFDLEAHAGGRITNNLTEDKPQKAEYGPSRWLEFSKGTPESTVKVTTVSGRITLDKK